MRTLLLTLAAAAALGRGVGVGRRLGHGRREPGARRPDGRVDLGREDHDPPARQRGHAVERNLPTLSLIGKGGEKAKTSLPRRPRSRASTATVKFPAAAWTYEVYDGFISTAAPGRTRSAPSRSGRAPRLRLLDLPSLPLTAAILLGVAAAIALVFGMRRMRPGPAPQSLGAPRAGRAIAAPPVSTG